MEQYGCMPIHAPCDYSRQDDTKDEGENMENKKVTNTAKFILNVWNIGLFAGIWYLFYNSYTFETYTIPGALVSILVYTIIYTSLCKLYKAHRIASSEIGETVFSQILSFGIADIILYVECCLVFNRYVNMIPGLVTAMLQIIGTALIVMWTKQFLIKYVPPKNTLIVYGKNIAKEEVQQFSERLLRKYSHLFAVSDIRMEVAREEKTFREILQYDVVILYDVSGDLRGNYIGCLVENRKAFYLSPRVEDIMLQGCVPKHLLDTPLMKYDYKYENKSGYRLKRAFDIVFSLLILLALSPVLLLIALLIKIEDGGPVFFKQARCTKDGRVFDILKFRSMIVDAEKQGVTPCTDKDPRITRIGSLIRKTRLDEMPQFINILKGDMSIVGPRPERVEHVSEYTKEVPEFAYRMRVPGGLTGYAQIYGKYNTSAYDKLRLDLLYIENQSFLLDLKLILLTIRTVFTPESTEGFEKEKSEEMLEKAKNTKSSSVSRVVSMKAE